MFYGVHAFLKHFRHIGKTARHAVHEIINRGKILCTENLHNSTKEELPKTKS